MGEHSQKVGEEPDGDVGAVQVPSQVMDLLKVKTVDHARGVRLSPASGSTGLFRQIPASMVTTSTAGAPYISTFRTMGWRRTGIACPTYGTVATCRSTVGVLMVASHGSTPARPVGWSLLVDPELLMSPLDLSEDLDFGPLARVTGKRLDEAADRASDAIAWQVSKSRGREVRTR